MSGRPRRDCSENGWAICPPMFLGRPSITMRGFLIGWLFVTGQSTFTSNLLFEDGRDVTASPSPLI